MAARKLTTKYLNTFSPQAHPYLQENFTITTIQQDAALKDNSQKTIKLFLSHLTTAGFFISAMKHCLDVGKNVAKVILSTALTLKADYKAYELETYL